MRHTFCGFRLPRLHPIDEIATPQFPRRHVHQLLDVNSGNYGFLGAISGTVITLYAGAPTVLDDEPSYWLIGENDSTMFANECCQRLRQRSRTSDGNGPSAALLPEYRIGESSGHGRLRGHMPPWACKHEGLAMFIFEIVTNDFPRGHRLPSHPELTLRVFGQAISRRLSEANGAKHNRIEEWLNG